MKLTNGELFDAAAPFVGLSQQKFPVKVSMAILKLGQQMEPTMEIINVMREKLFTEYGEGSPLKIPESILVPDEENEGRMLKVRNPNYDKFLAQWNELRDETVELENFSPVTLPDTAVLSPLDMIALEKFVKVA